MRLRLFRGRSWWPGLKRRQRPGGSPDRPGSSQVSGQGSRPGTLTGSHRKTRTAVPVPVDLTGRQQQRPARGQPDGPSARAGQGGPTSGGTRPSGAGHAIPSQWARRPRVPAAPGTTQARSPRDSGQDAAAASAAAASAAPRAAARAAVRTRPDGAGQAAADVVAQSAEAASSTGRARLDGRANDGRADHGRADHGQPWYSAVRPRALAAGQRSCGCLEDVLVREWAVDEEPVPEAAVAIDRLAALPLLIKEKLAAGLDAIHVGAGGVPDLDHMGQLKGVPLPSGRATWDACAGAYGDRKIVVGSRPSPTPDVMCHEVGHALDDIDGSEGCWQSDSADYRALYGRCLPHMASEFHRHSGALGRREFFADSFAAIASSQRPALVEMLSGDTRTALDVMLYFNVRYGL
jgi:hypothetical protein